MTKSSVEAVVVESRLRRALAAEVEPVFQPRSRALGSEKKERERIFKGEVSGSRALTLCFVGLEPWPLLFERTNQNRWFSFFKNALQSHSFLKVSEKGLRLRVICRENGFSFDGILIRFSSCFRPAWNLMIALAYNKQERAKTKKKTFSGNLISRKIPFSWLESGKALF